MICLVSFTLTAPHCAPPKVAYGFALQTSELLPLSQSYFIVEAFNVHTEGDKFSSTSLQISCHQFSCSAWSLVILAVLAEGPAFQLSSHSTGRKSLHCETWVLLQWRVISYDSNTVTQAQCQRFSEGGRINCQHR